MSLVWIDAEKTSNKLIAQGKGLRKIYWGGLEKNKALAFLWTRAFRLYAEKKELRADVCV